MAGLAPDGDDLDAQPAGPAVPIGRAEHDVSDRTVVAWGAVALKGQDQARQLRGRIGRPRPPSPIERSSG